MNNNYSNDIYMNDNIQNVDVSSVIGLLKIHILRQDNKSSKLNIIIMGVEYSGVNGGYCRTNGSSGYESKNPNSIYYKNKINEISTNRYLMENIGLLDGVGIDLCCLNPQ